MAEYIDREAVLDKRRKVTEYDEAGFAMNYQAVPVEDVEAIPAADVAEVVRCKECIYYEKEKEDAPPYCNNIDGLNEPDAGDFCSYGERKGDCNNCNNHSNERKGGVEK